MSIPSLFYVDFKYIDHYEYKLNLGHMLLCILCMRMTKINDDSESFFKFEKFEKLRPKHGFLGTLGVYVAMATGHRNLFSLETV